jgi:hypothetical protein
MLSHRSGIQFVEERGGDEIRQKHGCDVHDEIALQLVPCPAAMVQLRVELPLVTRLHCQRNLQRRAAVCGSAANAFDYSNDWQSSRRTVNRPSARRILTVCATAHGLSSMR